MELYMNKEYLSRGPGTQEDLVKRGKSLRCYTNRGKSWSSHLSKDIQHAFRSISISGSLLPIKLPTEFRRH